ncbi:MAG: Uma2 family endonuclease [Cyanobacteriota bacterium]|jgi:Uma2 family endonuclease
MTTLVKPQLSFDRFLAQCPDEGHFELINGEIVEMVNTRQHIDITDLIAKKIDQEIDRLNLNWVVKQNVVIKTTNKRGNEQGRIPDVSVIDRDFWRSAPTDYGALTEPIQMAVEVVSTNWENDYVDKVYEYEKLGVKEYWIVDYLAIASRDIIGDPKWPTISIYRLQETGQYERNQFQGEQVLESVTFPELAITPTQIFQAA